MGKAKRIMEELMRAGFDMTPQEFFRTTIECILRKYGVKEELKEQEVRELILLIIEFSFVTLYMKASGGNRTPDLQITSLPQWLLCYGGINTEGLGI